MALIRVAQYSSTPTVVGDYQAQNAHLQAFTNQLLTQQFILDSGTAKPVIKQGTYVSHGGSLYIADADTSITGSPSDGSVYIRVSGTTSLTVEFVTDISGYTWNPVHTALTSGSYTLLPYLIVKASTVWTRYNFNPQNQNFGAIKATSVDTGSGAMTFDQDVKTTDSPTFAGLTIGTLAAVTFSYEDLGNITIISKNISSMVIAELRWVKANISAEYTSVVKTPTTIGTYGVMSGNFIEMLSENQTISIGTGEKNILIIRIS